MVEQVRNFIFEYAPWLIFIPWLMALPKLGRFPPALKTIFLYLTTAVCTHVLSFILWKQKTNNLPLLHIYTLAEYLLLLRFFYLLLKGFLPAGLFYVLAVSFTLFAVFDSLYIENVFSLNTYSRSIEALILIFLSVCWFIKTLPDTATDHLSNKPNHYIVSGLLIYFAGAVVLFSFMSLIEEFAQKFKMNVWSIHTLLLVILYALISIGLWKHNKK